MRENHPSLWNMPVGKDDGIDPHYCNCGEPFEGKRTDKYCPHCIEIQKWLDEHFDELNKEDKRFLAKPKRKGRKS